MAKFDLRTVGVTGGNLPMRVAASATRGYVGEPLMTTPSYTTGTTDANTVIVCANDTPTVGTNEFKGICAEDFKDADGKTTGTVVAQYVNVTQFIPQVTMVRGKAETKANIDTQSELTGVLEDITRFGLASSTYTIQAGGEADTGALQIKDGNFSKGTLDCIVDNRGFRTDVTA